MPVNKKVPRNGECKGNHFFEKTKEAAHMEQPLFAYFQWQLVLRV
jgi:hypothetical protein